MVQLCRRPVRDEEGAVLILALVFLSLFGLFIGGILLEVDGHLRLTSTIRGEVAKQYAADAGVESGVQVLRTDLTRCQTAGGPTETLPSITHDGRTVQVQCQPLSGAILPSSGGSSEGVAIVTTNTAGHSLITQSGGNVPVNGSTAGQTAVFIAGPVSGSDLKAPVIVTNGNIQQHDANCAGPPAVTKDPDLQPVAPARWSCVAALPPDPPIYLPPSPPAAAPAPVDPAGKPCRVFFPGKYTAAPSFRTGNGESNYFASGVYYFENASINIPTGNNAYVGGAMSPTEPFPLQVLTAVTPCTDADANAAHAGSATGYGVEFVLGGSSTITVNNNASVELFTRVPGTAFEGAPRVSIYTVRQTASGWTVWSSGSPALNITTGGAKVAIHGRVYAYNAPVNAFASSGTIAQLLGGVFANVLTLQASASASGFAVTIPASTPSTTKTVLVRATATPLVAGEAPVVTEAVVSFTNNPAAPDPTTATATIVSWNGRV